MTAYPESAARFARETASHEMTVLHDSGLYRHLVFRERTHGFYWFELITTPDQLVFSGDGESFVFRRSPDMFEFFRNGIWPDGSRHINPVYWSEKLASERDASMRYSRKKFEAEVAKYLADAEQTFPGVTADWSKKTKGVLAEYNLDYEETAREALGDFEFMPDDGSEGEPFTFYDTADWELRDFYWWFLWASHAIVWGIARYDRLRSYGLERLAVGDLAANAVAEDRCLKAPVGCGQPLIAEDGTARVFWDEHEAAKYESEWRKTGLCPDCQDARTAKTAAVSA